MDCSKQEIWGQPVLPHGTSDVQTLSFVPRLPVNSQQLGLLFLTCLFPLPAYALQFRVYKEQILQSWSLSSSSHQAHCPSCIYLRNPGSLRSSQCPIWWLFKPPPSLRVVFGFDLCLKNWRCRTTSSWLVSWFSKLFFRFLVFILSSLWSVCI